MISPHTAPGTKIVCVDASITRKYSSPGFLYSDDLDGLQKDAVYTVREILPNRLAKSGFAVCLCEISRTSRGGDGFDIARFRYLHLPRSLTDLLETAPTRTPSELEPTQ